MFQLLLLLVLLWLYKRRFCSSQTRAPYSLGLTFIALFCFVTAAPTALALVGCSYYVSVVCCTTLGSHGTNYLPAVSFTDDYGYPRGRKFVAASFQGQCRRRLYLPWPNDYLPDAFYQWSTRCSSRGYLSGSHWHICFYCLFRGDYCWHSCSSNCHLRTPVLSWQ
jgi:hypothetical protein